jgi:asparaginyl-tRNA synthetase
VKRLTAGCAVIATGTLVQSQGQGQSVRDPGLERSKWSGWVEDPETYPIQPKAALAGIPARSRPPASAHQPVRRGHPHPQLPGAGGAPLLPRERLLLDQHTPIITTSDAEGAGQMFRVSTLDMANLPRTARAKGGFLARLLRQGSLPHRVRPAQRGGLCLALSKVYTFGPTFRAENSNTTRHLAEFWMIEPEIAFADLAEDANLAEDS